jgi:hypothetical protein
VRAVLLAGAALVTAAGCDSPTCIFTTGCGAGGGGGPAGPPATFPLNGEVIRDGAPTIEGVFPSGQAFLSSTSPIVLRFSESMSPASLSGAFEIVPLDPDNFPTAPIPGVVEGLAAEGRLLVLLPPTAIPAGNVVLRLSEDAVPTDLTGQRLVVSQPDEIASLAVDTDDPMAPQVLATFPPDGATDASETTSIVVVFDRRMLATSVDDGSFVVTVDGDEPAFDPRATPLAITVAGQTVTDSRAFVWRSVDDGEPVRLGRDALVEVTLSPAGDPIVSQTGMLELPTTERSFTTASISAPLGASLLSQPSDAIGIANLTAGGPDELLVQVELDAAEPGDRLDLFLFGESGGEASQVVALMRQVTLEGMAPITMASFDLDAIDLVGSTDPIAARFADGPVAFAFRLRRGNAVTPVTLLDVDPDLPGIQDPVLDTTGPTILELVGEQKDDMTIASDLRDVVIAGRADEPVRSVSVTTDRGDNGTLPPVVGTSADGLFVAAPVPVGILAGGSTSFTAIAFDAASNPSDPITGTFVQRGVVGPGALVPGAPIEVEVFDDRTLEPLAGARVFTHADPGDASGFPLVASAITDMEGRATLASAAAPAVGTLLSVDLAGYDLFTFHGVPADHLSIPLAATGSGPSATVSGEVTTESALASLLLDGFQRALADSRRPAEALRLFPTLDCTKGGPFGLGELSCAFAPEPIRPDRLGVLSFLSGNFQLSQAMFDPELVLQAFVLAIPVPATAAGTEDSERVVVPFLLSEQAAPEADAPIALPALQILATVTTGIDLDDLVDDPQTVGVPHVTIETVAPGVPGSVVVGLGLAYEQSPNVWTLRSAVPGAVTPGGRLGQVLDTDAFVRVELRDTAGNRAGQRPRLSTLATLPLPGILVPNFVPQLASPPPGGSTGGASFDLVFGNVIIDFSNEAGLYRATLTDERGRRWFVWTVDPPDAAGAVLVHVPEIASEGGNPLANGELEVELSAFAWPSLDTSAFLWTDIEREQDVFAHSAPVTITQP